MESSGGGGSTSAPTGCYKCGRPGHWSRDCPSNPNPSSAADATTTPHAFKSVATGSNASKPAGEKPKKIPKTRPKLTPDLLLSDDGVGYVLRNFPRSFKFHGRGHEVSDLGNLLGLYAEWHSRLLPYFPFDQFVRKVEQVGTAKRVKVCMRELQDKIANGGDPTKLQDTPSQQNTSNPDEVAAEAVDLENPIVTHEETSLKNHDIDDFQEEILHEIYGKATDERSNAPTDNTGDTNSPSDHDLMESPKVSDNTVHCSSEIQMSEEQRSRVEANRLRALERAASRARSSKAV